MSDQVTEARELLGSVDKSRRVAYAFRLLATLADEVEELRATIRRLTQEPYDED